MNKYEFAAFCLHEKSWPSHFLGACAITAAASGLQRIDPPDGSVGKGVEALLQRARPPSARPRRVAAIQDSSIL